MDQPTRDVLDDDTTEPDDPGAGPVGDLIRRFAALGLSGFFNTESAVRKAFGDTVPQEWVDFASDQSDRGRQELFDRLAQEMRRAFEDMDVEALIEDLLTDRDIEIEAKVRIRPRERPRKKTSRRASTGTSGSTRAPEREPDDRES